MLSAVVGRQKKLSSSIEQEHKKLKINRELGDLCGYGYGSIEGFSMVSCDGCLGALL